MSLFIEMSCIICGFVSVFSPLFLNKTEKENIEKYSNIFEIYKDKKIKLFFMGFVNFYFVWPAIYPVQYIFFSVIIYFINVK